MAGADLSSKVGSLKILRLFAPLRPLWKAVRKHSSAELDFTRSFSNLMNRSSALELLDSPRAHERLLAARFLSKSALQEDADSIQLALTRENVYWIRTALSSALKRIR